MPRYLEVLEESKSPKPCAVLLRDGGVATKKDGKISEDLLLGGADTYDRLMAEKPPRVKKVKQ